MPPHSSSDSRSLDRDLSWVVPENLFHLPTFVKFRALLPEFSWTAWQSAPVRDANAGLVKRRSSFGGAIIGNKGGWLFPEKAYLDCPTHLTRAPEHDEQLDRFILEQPMCHSLATRFRHVTQVLLPRYVRTVLADRGVARIASLGSGTGRDVLLTMEEGEGDVRADLVDIDPRALSEGGNLAKLKGLEARVRFINRDMMALGDGDYDIVLLVGIICSLPDTLARKVLRRMRRLVRPGGFVIVSTPSEKMPSDLLCRFLIEYCAEWFLEYRDCARTKRLARTSGYTVVEVSEEPLGFHRFVVATP